MLHFLLSFRRDQHKQDVFKPVTLDFSLKTSGTKSSGHKQCSVLREPHFLWLINSSHCHSVLLSRSPVFQEMQSEWESCRSPAEPHILMRLCKCCLPSWALRAPNGPQVASVTSKGLLHPWENPRHWSSKRTLPASLLAIDSFEDPDIALFSSPL